MSVVVFFAVLGAALLHAVWNAMVKGGRNKDLNMASVVLGQGLFGVALLPFVPAPAPESWPWIALSVSLHIGYQIFLMGAYRIGDLTQVYPIARGTAPLIVAGVSVTVLGVELSAAELTGVLMISGGIMSLWLVRQSDGGRNLKAALLAVATGVFIAAYSLCDGNGARIAGTALGFYGWAALGNALVYLAIVEFRRPGIVRGLPSTWRTVLLGGGASYTAYAIVVWAFTQAPIALVTALRETSIVFALFIGVLFLKERLDLWKLASTAIAIAGAVLLRLSKG